MESKLLKGEEVANQLGISKAYAYRLMSSGEIKRGENWQNCPGNA